MYDQALFNNSIALNLLYILTLSDVDRDWILSSSEIRDQLYELQVKGNKKEVSRLARKCVIVGIDLMWLGHCQLILCFFFFFVLTPFSVFKNCRKVAIVRMH